MMINIKNNKMKILVVKCLVSHLKEINKALHPKEKQINKTSGVLN